MNLLDYPAILFALSLVALWLSAQSGAYLRSRRANLISTEREDLGVILAATLTLLALIIGFSFSMATTRYDQRKNYEEQEANAIGTEYLRADLLSPVNAAKVRSLLRSYLDQRILFFAIHDEEELRQISARTVQLQAELWAAIKPAAVEQPTPVRPRHCGHERRVELAGIHAGCLLEPNPNCCMGADDGNRHLL